jgi:crotonobetainyl-CoA:carnitine CoA-transferase CaiB-like acyl-CoA transferase
MRLGRATPVLGSETTEILGEIGYASSDIESLISAGVAVQT